MPRIARMFVKGEDMVYHVISRTALDGYVMGDIEKEYLLKLIKKLSSVYVAPVLAFVWWETIFILWRGCTQEKGILMTK